MNTLGLLNKYSKARTVINTFFTNKMIESFSDESVPEEFKEYMKATGIDDENLAKMIDVSPRALFDVFDENQLYIQVVGDDKNGWDWEVGSAIENAVCKTRKEAETEAVREAFSQLNDKL